MLWGREAVGGQDRKRLIAREAQKCPSLFFDKKIKKLKNKHLEFCIVRLVN